MQMEDFLKKISRERVFCVRKERVCVTGRKKFGRKGKCFAFSRSREGQQPTAERASAHPLLSSSILPIQQRPPSSSTSSVVVVQITSDNIDELVGEPLLFLLVLLERQRAS